MMDFKFATLILAVMLAAGITLYVGLLLTGSSTLPPIMLIIGPCIALAVYLAAYVVRRRRDPE